MGVLSSRSLKLGFVAACVLSVLIGAALVFVLVQPTRVAMVRTTELYAVLAMLVLPGFTAWANRRVRRVQPASSSAPAAGTRAGLRASARAGAGEVRARAMPAAPAVAVSGSGDRAGRGVAQGADPSERRGQRTARPRAGSEAQARAEAAPDVIVIPAELLRPYYRRSDARAAGGPVSQVGGSSSSAAAERVPRRRSA